MAYVEMEIDISKLGKLKTDMATEASTIGMEPGSWPKDIAIRDEGFVLPMVHRNFMFAGPDWEREIIASVYIAHLGTRLLSLIVYND